MPETDVINVFDIDLIKIGVSVCDKTALLEMMISDLSKRGFISNIEEFKEAIFARELALSTGIGRGVAVPHARHETVNSLKVVVYILTNEINFDALDGNPVNIVFMLAVPEESHSDYVRTLSKISKLMTDETNRESLMSCGSSEEVYEYIVIK